MSRIVKRQVRFKKANTQKKTWKIEREIRKAKKTCLGPWRIYKRIKAVKPSPYECTNFALPYDKLIEPWMGSISQLVLSYYVEWAINKYGGPYFQIDLNEANIHARRLWKAARLRNTQR